ncbi:MAG: NADH-ubiquinone oxidoreductase-F iron-sulfur binding region domain-containing protein [Patescibacteria group bacterium]|nr:NADH-ubiquinone oxidoreductase-F iron-sulfur binding region domain-containing protein [Patescibacteria group bacterium]
MNDIIQKLKKAELTGRGGGAFPTGKKWEIVKKTKADKKYVVCNASEGEPGVGKDWYILDKYGGRVIDGMKIALDYLGADKAFLYLNPDYYFDFKEELEKIIGNAPIEIFRKPYQAGYVGGEESSALNALEHERIEPRLRPPFPTTSGLYARPTLINNVETFYDVSLIARDEYEKKRFITISGIAKHEKVFFLKEHWTIEIILKHTNNWPDFDFFVQVGGNASGQVLHSTQLKQPISGSGLITIYDMTKENPIDLIKTWVDFFMNESCGQCTPCREGTLRLHEILKQKNPNWKMFSSLLNTLHDTSFCGLGRAVPIPIRSYVNNVLSKKKKHNINISKEEHELIKAV